MIEVATKCQTIFVGEFKIARGSTFEVAWDGKVLHSS
jgi:hypothetical protein